MLRISSYNCKSSKRNIGGISRVCAVSDIVFLQEHWLFPADLCSLNSVHSDFMAFGVSSIDPSNGLLSGRPFGGVAVLWRKTLAPLVNPISFDDDRIIGLECCINGLKLLLLGVYLPYNTKHNFDQYVYYLAKLKSIIDDHDSPHVCILGDFNADIIKQTEFGTELDSFCHDANLMIADTLLLPPDSITHVNDGNGNEFWLDHIVCTQGLYSLIQDIGIDTAIVSSDHFPIFIKLALGTAHNNLDLNEVSESTDRWLVDWSSVEETSVHAFTEAVNTELSKVAIPYEAVHCRADSCDAHNNDISAYYEQILNGIRNASRSTVATKLGNHKTRVIPGWSEFVDEKHTLLGDIYSLWALVGKPRHGYIYDQLRIARAQFKYSLRFCLRNEKDLRAKALAEKFAKNPRNMATFWKEVRKLSSNPPLAQSVAGVSGEVNIANMWKDHFSSVLNSVNNESSKEHVLSQINENDIRVTAFTAKEVMDSIFSLSSGRSAGCDELNAEHFKFAGTACAVHLSLCFSMMLSHNFLPAALTKVILNPIVKDKTGDISDQDNYRPIALATVSSKIFERLILDRCHSNLATGDHQFGFKQRHSTDMAVYAFKEIADHYLRNNSSVFICFLDARKAFDRVNHWTLFKKLLQRGMDAGIVRLLVTWYSSQQFYVRWGASLSDGFSVSNGVRQGGILSPYLFNAYTDGLSECLNLCGVGCHYQGSINHLYYADDMVLLSPTPQGLQKMLCICEQYALAHDIVFNTKKTVCMAILSTLFRGMPLPDILLCGNVLSYVDSYKYLGFHISSAFSKCDDLELRHQYRLLCCRANSMIRKFAMCSYYVKRYLYTAYCSNVSNVHLWHSYRACMLKKFKVCFNNAARMFFGYDRFCSASGMFVCERIDDFHAVYRKSVSSFISRLGQSDNHVISRLFNSDLAHLSSVRKQWYAALFA